MNTTIVNIIIDLLVAWKVIQLILIVYFLLFDRTRNDENY